MGQSRAFDGATRANFDDTRDASPDTGPLTEPPEQSAQPLAEPPGRNVERDRSSSWPKGAAGPSHGGHPGPLTEASRPSIADERSQGREPSAPPGPLRSHPVVLGSTPSPLDDTSELQVASLRPGPSHGGHPSRLSSSDCPGSGTPPNSLGLLTGVPPAVLGPAPSCLY